MLPSETFPWQRVLNLKCCEIFAPMLYIKKMLTSLIFQKKIKKKKKPQDLSPHIVIVMLGRPDIEGLKTLNIFCWP
jgi:hypothetical protein